MRLDERDSVTPFPRLKLYFLNPRTGGGLSQPRTGGGG